MKPWAILLFSVASFSLLVLITLSFLAPQIESRLKEKVIESLTEYDFNWVNVSVKGRVIILKGISPTRLVRTEVEKIAANIFGISTIDNQLTVAEPLQPYTLTADYDGERLSLNGYTGEKKTQRYIDDNIMTVYGKNKVISQWTLREGQPSAWGMVTSGVIATLKIAQQGHVVFKDQKLELMGTVDSTELKHQMERQLSSYSTQGYKIQSKITVLSPALSCQAKFNQILQKKQILFANAGATIDQKSYALLTQLKKVMNQCERFGVIISGHTDSNGNDTTNQHLSLRRAKAVAHYFTKLGASTKHISTMGYGELKPIAENETEEGRAKNRRIEFTIKGH